MSDFPSTSHSYGKKINIDLLIVLFFQIINEPSSLCSAVLMHSAAWLSMCTYTAISRRVTQLISGCVPLISCAHQKWNLSVKHLVPDQPAFSCQNCILFMRTHLWFPYLCQEILEKWVFVADVLITGHKIPQLPWNSTVGHSSLIMYIDCWLYT